jgi:prevent-host-death family protein
MIVTAQEAQSRFVELLTRVRESHIEIVITENGVTVARLAPPETTPRRRTPGMDAGKVIIAPEFDAPLPDELHDAFEGR